MICACLIWSLLSVPLVSAEERGSDQVAADSTADVQDGPRSGDTAADAGRVARAEKPSSERRWRQTNSSVALVHGDHVVWQFNYGPTLNTPFFHPVSTVDGRVLSWDRPPDHAWHHGLWFCWKFINGVNYWEHSGQTGKPEGRTEWSDVRVETRDDHSARISMALAYHPAGIDEVVLNEQRQIDISAPDANGLYRLDWMSKFTAGTSDVTLDRVPPKVQSWGGYAGLSIRFAKDLEERMATRSEGPAEFGEGGRHRSRAQAMDYNGLIDGKAVGLAFLDHPDNPRHPTPWYAIRDSVMSYINAALLTDEPLTLNAGEHMTLRYRLIVHPQRWDAARLRAAYADFQESENPPRTE